MQREVLATQRRVLGAEHPDTLTAASNLEQCLYEQEEHAEEGESMGSVGAERQAGATAKEPSAPVEEGEESEVHAARKRAAEGSRACADAAKRTKQ